MLYTTLMALNLWATVLLLNGHAELGVLIQMPVSVVAGLVTGRAIAPRPPAIEADALLLREDADVPILALLLREGVGVRLLLVDEDARFHDRLADPSVPTLDRPHPGETGEALLLTATEALHPAKTGVLPLVRTGARRLEIANVLPLVPHLHESAQDQGTEARKDARHLVRQIRSAKSLDRAPHRRQLMIRMLQHRIKTVDPLKTMPRTTE